MDKLFSSVLNMLSWTSTEAPIRAASLLGRLSRSAQFEPVLGAEMGRIISFIRALAALFSDTNHDVSSCSMRCCWELLRGSSQGSMSLFMSLLFEESNSQLLKTVFSDCVMLLNASNTYLAIQSTLILNQILAVRDAPQRLADLRVLKTMAESCCNVIALADANASFHQLPVQLQVGSLRLVLRACADADCLTSMRRNELFNDMMSQLQQATLASNKQVSSFAVKVINVLQNTQNASMPEASTSAAALSSSQNGTTSDPGQQLSETAAPSSVDSIFAHGKALRSAIIKESPSIFLSAAATKAMADEFQITSSLLVQEQGKVEQLTSKVLLLELELRQKELQNQSLLDESRAVSGTLSSADAAIRQLQEDIELRDKQLLAASDTNHVIFNKDLEIGTLKAELETQQYRCDAFSQEISRLRLERLELVKAAADMEQVKSELGVSSVLAASLQRQLHERDQLLSTLQLQNQKLQEEVQTRDQLLILAHSQAATALETVTAVETASGFVQNDNFSSLLADANKENAGLRSRISELENELMKQSRDSSKKLDELAMVAFQEKGSLVQQIADLENRLKEQSQELQRLSSESLDSRVDSAPLLSAPNSELEAENLSLREQIAHLKSASNVHSEAIWSDYTEKSALEIALEEESKALRAQLESQLVDFQGIMDAKDHIIEQLTDQVKKQQQQLEDAQAVNQVNSSTIISQSSIIGDLQSQVDELAASNSAPPSIVSVASSSPS